MTILKQWKGLSFGKIVAARNLNDLHDSSFSAMTCQQTARTEVTSDAMHNFLRLHLARTRHEAQQWHTVKVHTVTRVPQPAI